MCHCHTRHSLLCLGIHRTWPPDQPRSSSLVATQPKVEIIAVELKVQIYINAHCPHLLNYSSLSAITVCFVYVGPGYDVTSAIRTATI